MTRACFLTAGLAVAALAAEMLPAAQMGASRPGATARAQDATDIAQQFAQCLANRENRWTNRFLATIPGSEAERRVYMERDGVNRDCIASDSWLRHGKGLQISVRRLRMLITEHLAQEFIRSSVGPAPGSASAWFTSQIEQKSDDVKDRGLVFSYLLGACVVDEHWGLARQFIAAASYSDAERSALSQIATILPQCVPEGATMNLDRPMLRSVVAEAVYHAFQDAS